MDQPYLVNAVVELELRGKMAQRLVLPMVYVNGWVVAPSLVYEQEKKYATVTRRRWRRIPWFTVERQERAQHTETFDAAVACVMGVVARFDFGGPVTITNGRLTIENTYIRVPDALTRP